MAKTDRIDARLIARYGSHFEPEALAYQSAGHNRLRELVQRHRQLTLARVSEANRAAHLECADLRRLSAAYLRLLQRQLATIDALMEKELLLQHSAAVTALTAVCGIGSQSAALLLAELPELGKVAKGRIAALAGGGSLQSRQRSLARPAPHPRRQRPSPFEQLRLGACHTAVI